MSIYYLIGFESLSRI
jgi:hypothetical protein